MPHTRDLIAGGAYPDAFLREGARAHAPERSLPASPTTGTPGLSPAQKLSNAFGSIIQTGKAASQKATLLNPQTGERVPVTVGSQEAQQYFGKGFILETAPGQTTAAPSAPTNPTPPQPKTPVPGFLTQAKQLRSEMFASVYGYTPDEWQDLDPSAQRKLRNQRVIGLEAQLGNVEAAIEAAREEEKFGLEKLNLFLKYGAVDKMDESELRAISGTLGISPTTLKAMGSQKDPPELRNGPNGSIYSFEWDEEAGTYKVDQLLAGKEPEGEKEKQSAFEKWYEDFVEPDEEGFARKYLGFDFASIGPNRDLKDEAFKFWRDSVKEKESAGITDDEDSPIEITNPEGLKIKI